MAKILCVLYDDPIGGYPKSYARDGIPKIDRYPGGQSAPSPKHIDFKPGELLGSVSGELGLRKFLEGLGHTFVVTADKEGPTSVFERELPDAEVVISQPFWPAYLTEERIAKAKKLKLAITAGIGSDHVDLQAAIKHGVTANQNQPSRGIAWWSVLRPVLERPQARLLEGFLGRVQITKIAQQSADRLRAGRGQGCVDPRDLGHSLAPLRLSAL